MSKLIAKTGSYAGREFELKPGLNRVGRSAANEAELTEPSISNIHCEIQVAEIATSVRDLNSTNGTFVNRKRVSKALLQQGDVLTLGDVEFAVELDEVEVAIPEMKFEEAPGAAFLEDGTPGCFTHREAAATHRCTKCENWWCNECVRLLKRTNGQFLRFCPECDGPCEVMAPEAAGRRPQGFFLRSFFSRLGDTLRITRRKD